MTNKIIIDGIDVSECKYIGNDYSKCTIQYYTWCGRQIAGYESCRDNPNCHYKQLKRKEQECKKFKEIDIELIRYLLEIFEALGVDTGPSILGSNCIEFYAVHSSTAKNRIKQYKQALDEIEFVCKNLLDDDYMRSVAESLLDIINKTEEQ